jgi:hypothetical protein
MRIPRIGFTISLSSLYELAPTVTSEWFWYRAFSRPELLNQSVDRATTRQLLEERREDIRPEVGKSQQSERGKLFEMLADLTDEDGAYTEMQDLDDLYE